MIDHFSATAFRDRQLIQRARASLVSPFRPRIGKLNSGNHKTGKNPIAQSDRRGMARNGNRGHASFGVAKGAIERLELQDPFRFVSTLLSPSLLVRRPLSVPLDAPREARARDEIFRHAIFIKGREHRARVSRARRDWTIQVYMLQHAVGLTRFHVRARVIEKCTR